jgi:glutathione S-transferase
MSFTLYDYVLSGNCYKIRLLASLLNVDYQSIAVNFHPGGEHKSESMLRVSPAGTLPILVDGDLVLSETQAMLAWMAGKFDKSGTWWPCDDPVMAADILQWLGFSSSLTASVGEARLHSMLNREVDFDKTINSARHALRVLESHLSERAIAGSQWIVGDTATIADIACFPYTALSPDAGIEHDSYPAIRNWLYAIRSLDGFVTMPGIHAMHELRDGERDHGK